MAILQELPSEILYHIVRQVEACNDIYSFARTCRLHNEIASPDLYVRAVQNPLYRVVHWAARSGNSGTLLKAINAGAALDDVWYANSTTLVRYTTPTIGQEPTDSISHGDTEHDMEIYDDEDESEEFDEWEDGGEYEDAYELISDGSDFSGEEMDPVRRDPVVSRKWYEQGRFWCTALHLACYHGHLDIVRILVEHGAKLNMSSRGLCDCVWDVSVVYEARRPLYTPLHTAICKDREEITKLLIEKGCKLVVDVKARTGRRFGITAVHAAVEKGNIPLAEWLLEGGYFVSLDIGDRLGYRPLRYAYTANQWKAMRWLLEQGAEADCSADGDSTGTLLDRACVEASWNAADIILDHSVDMDLTPLIRKTLQLRAPQGFTHAGQYPNYIPEVSDGPQGFDHPRLTITRKLIAKGADINNLDHSGGTVLTTAAKLHSVPLITALIALGADVGLGSPAPLTAACGTNSDRLLDVVNCLLDGGSPVNVDDNAPLVAAYQLAKCASFAKDNTGTELIATFLQTGANPNPDLSESLLLGAFKEIAFELCDLLLKYGAKFDAEVFHEMCTTAINTECACNACDWKTVGQLAYALKIKKPEMEMPKMDPERLFAVVNLEFSRSVDRIDLARSLIDYDAFPEGYEELRGKVLRRLGRLSL